MKKISIIIICFLLSLGNTTAQNDGAAAAAGVAAGILYLGAAVISSENHQSHLTRAATEWFLSKYKDIDNFQLKGLEFDGKRSSDNSNTSLVIYRIEELVPEKLPSMSSIIAPTLRELNEAVTKRKWVLLAFSGDGWVDNSGLKVSRVQWLLMDQEEWLNIVIAYVALATGNTDRDLLRNEIINGKITDRGIRRDGLSVPFYYTGLDMYLSSDYNDDIKLVYNRTTMGFFLKATDDLIQMSREAIADINNYFFSK
jgi:hypothetical protein